MKNNITIPKKPQPPRRRGGAELFISRITTAEFRSDVMRALHCFMQIEKEEGKVQDLIRVCTRMGAPKPTKANGLLGDNDAALRWRKALYAVYNTLRKSDVIIAVYDTDSQQMHYEINRDRWSEITNILHSICAVQIF